MALKLVITAFLSLKHYTVRHYKWKWVCIYCSKSFQPKWLSYFSSAAIVPICFSLSQCH